MKKFITPLLVSGALILAVAFLVFVPRGFSPAGQPVKLPEADSWSKVKARTVANLVKSKLGKVKYIEYTVALTPGFEYLKRTKAQIITKSGDVYIVTYMEDTRPHSKDHFGIWMSVKDVQTGEEFTDQNIEGIPSLSGQPENVDRVLWVQTYRATLDKIYESM